MYSPQTMAKSKTTILNISGFLLGAFTTSASCMQKIIKSKPRSQ